MKSILMKLGRAVNALCKKTYWYNEVLFPDCAKFWNHNAFNLDVVNFGSTSGIYAFNYEGIPLRCANWALGHNPLQGDEALLKNYMSYLNPKHSTVIFSLCPFSSLAGSYDILDDRYYTILYSSSIPSFSKRKQTKILHMKNRPLKYYPIYEALKDLGRLIVSPFKKGKIKVLTEDQMKKDALKWMNGWRHEFSLKLISENLSLINRDAINDSITILLRLANFCHERNITPVYVIPPVYHTLSESMSKNEKKLIIDDMLQALELKGEKVFNFLDDPEFSLKPDLFINSFYLNSIGSKKFTQKLLKKIELI